MSRKPGLSFAKHRATGAKLLGVRDDLAKLVVEIAAAYPNTSKATRLAGKVVDAIDNLRCELDSQLFKDCPAETTGDNWKGLYYGGRP